MKHKGQCSHARRRQFCRSGGIGSGTLYVFDPAPTPPWHVFGGVVQTECVPWHAGTTSGMLGYMFWAAECQGTHSVCTTPPNTCQGGVGAGSKTYNVPLPMPPLRQN